SHHRPSPRFPYTTLFRSGLTNERGCVPVDWNTMRADESSHRNIYAVGDCIGNPGPKQGHLALMQATVAAEHIAWRINQKGSVRRSEEHTSELQSHFNLVC